MSVCGKCGTTNPDDRVACRRCKAPLNDVVPGDKSFAGPTLPAPPREPQLAPDNSSFGGPTHQSHSTPLPDEPAGTVFADRYQIIEPLGRGGMGVVYRVRDLSLARDVALKRLHAQQESARLGIERFVQEARAIAALNHRNIITVHEFVESAPGPFIVMEYLPGGDLARRLREHGGKLEPAEALEIVRLVGQALAYAHRRNIFHRDVKPSNILLAEDGTPKLVDFGLARLAKESELTLSGQGMGTSAFMAPEQKRDAKHVDHRSDIFSLAKTLYCLLTGEVPDSPDLDEVPASMRPAMKKALKLKPEDRPFSVEEFLHELDAPAAAGPITVLDLPGACPQCGKPNPETVRFCRACGAGLFDKCPACGAEDRIGIKHCGSCGVSIAKYKESADALAAARKHLDEFRYSRAVKEADRGLAAGHLQDDLRKLRTEAAAKADRLESLRAEAAKLVEQERYEEAEGKLKEALKLDPNHEELARVLNTTTERRIAAYATARKKRLDILNVHARELLEEGEYEQAGAALREALKIAPRDPQVLKLVAKVPRLIWHGLPRGWAVCNRIVSIANSGRVIDQRITYYRNSMGVEFVLVEPGEFLMGSPSTERQRNEDEVQHPARISKCFLISSGLVTQEQWLRIFSKNPSNFPGGRLPVESVSWFEAQDFCQTLSEREGLIYRLPSEEEWEFSCRAGTKTAFYAGDAITTDLANCNGNFLYGSDVAGANRGKPTPAGTFPANPWGLFDMHGNVWEWCSNTYRKYGWAELDVADDNEPKVLRGGCWARGPRFCRSACRGCRPPGLGGSIIGFRPCVNIN